MAVAELSVFRMQHVLAGYHQFSQWCCTATDAVPPIGETSNFAFGQGAGNSAPNLHKGHRGIFNVHQGMLTDETPSLTSIRGMSHTLINHTA